MNIRFLIHDRTQFPEGASLDVDFNQLSPRQVELLEQTLDESGACTKPLQVAGINVANVWLVAPSIDALKAELARAGALVDKFEAKRKARVRQLGGES